jgi:hypothetical protein
VNQRGAQDRASYLNQLCDLLWPPPAQALPATARPMSGGRGEADDTAMLVLPRLRDPRLLVPAEPRAGSAAVRRYGEPGSVRSRLVTRVAAAVLASGLGGLVLRDRISVRVPPGAQTIESHLSSALGRPVLVSIHLGAARANRKPVLQLLTPSGESIGFAKIGHNQLTADLVRAEHAALGLLNAAGLISLQVPPVLGLSGWRGMEVLVLGPLPVWQRRTPLRPGQLTSAMAEVASVAGVRHAPLAASEYWQRLTERVDRTGGTERAALRAAIDQLATRAGISPVGFGSWHGDWTRWNMASTPGGLLVWDWERFTTGVPVGFDALHCWLQAEVVGGRRDPARAAADCVRRAPALLEPFGVPPALAGLTALLYLADLSARYLTDQQEQAGAPLGAPRQWLLPALTAGISGLLQPG